MTVTQLDPPIPLKVGIHHAMAQLVIDYGPEYDLVWVCFLDNGECWSVGNSEVRADVNWTFKRAPPPAPTSGG